MVRDRAAVFWTFLFPLFFIVIFGLVFSEADTARFSVGLVKEDSSPLAEGVATGLSLVPVFDLHQGNRDDEMKALRKGDRRAVVIIPPGFGTQAGASTPAKLEVYYDPTQSVSGQSALAAIRVVVDKIDRSLSNQPSLLVTEEKPVDVRNIRYIDFLVPGILGMALMQVGIFSGASMVVDRQNQILKRLGATPLPRGTLVVSQVVMRLILAVVQAFEIIIAARLLFNVSIAGNWLLLLLVVAVGALAFISLGYCVAAFARTEETAMVLAQIISFPMMFLSGIFFPLETMPDFLAPLIKVLPLTYLGDALRQVMVQSSGIMSLTAEMGILAGWLVVGLLISSRFFRWE